MGKKRVTAFRRAMEDAILECVAGRELPAPLVDLGGAGKKAWLSELLGRSDVQTWDLAAGPDVDLQVDACEMDDVAYDSVGTLMSFCLLEHVASPWDAALEMAKVVRPGGLLLVATAWQYPYHPAKAMARPPGSAPPAMCDYWRVSLDGLRALFGRRFEELKGGYFTGEPGVGVYFLGRKGASSCPLVPVAPRDPCYCGFRTKGG